MSRSDRCCREGALRAAVLKGDERAWQALYDQTAAPLFAYIAWRCGGLQERAEEVAQDTWLVAVRRIATFDPVRGTFLSWLRGIAGNHLRTHLRQRSADPLNADMAVSEVSHALRLREQGEAVAQALAELPERYEAVLRCKYLEQQTVEQIAIATGETAKAVESLLTRARQAFRDAYARVMPEEAITRGPGHE